MQDKNEAIGGGHTITVVSPVDILKLPRRHAESWTDWTRWLEAAGKRAWAVHIVVNGLW
jgi:hypothetical protein